jgi:hypothetical protein
VQQLSDEETNNLEDNNSEEFIEDELEESNPEESVPVLIDDTALEEYSSNKQVITLVKSKFKRLPRAKTKELIKFILKNFSKINMNLLIKTKSFFLFNKARVDEEGFLKIDFLKTLKTEINGKLVELGKEIKVYDEKEHKDFNVTVIDGEDCYLLDKNSKYSRVRKLTCDEDGNVRFVYDFNKKDLNLSIPDNKDTLQRCQIQILSRPIKFDYPIEFNYCCPQCFTVSKRKSYLTVSTGNRIKCEGIYFFVNPDGEQRSSMCRTPLSPDNEVSLTKDAFYYDIGYEDINGDKQTVGALSFDKYEPGFYECVMFKLNSPMKKEAFQIMDIKPIKPNVFNLPKKIKKENYIFTLQKTIDEFIKKQTGMDIYGLLPIKIALMIQYMFGLLDMRLIGSLQIVGDASTGKSTILKYYGFVLANQFNMSTNGLSISVAGLRGTPQTISLMGKEIKIVTIGYLGTFRTIHIDEAGENRELIQNLKTFLMEDNYSYDKAGATGSFHKRTAQINISENLDYHHLGMYRGTIKKAYRDESFKIEGEDKEPWNDEWDLHLPLYEYTWNPHLRKVIKDMRIDFRLKQKWWIDGYEFAVHERFPFYFYLVSEKKNDKLAKVVRDNNTRTTISENLELIKSLKSLSLKKFFNSLKKYVVGKNDYDGFVEVDKILDDYDIHADARTKVFFQSIAKVSRIINQRDNIEEQDLNLVRWFIEKMNCKLDIVETCDYNIKGSEVLNKEDEINIDKQVQRTKDNLSSGVETNIGDDFFDDPYN